MRCLLFWKGKCVKMISNKKGIEGLFGKEFVEKVKEAKKERQKEEKELELYEKQLDKKRKNLTNFLHKVYENEIVQELIESREYNRIPIYRLGLATIIVFEKRGIYLEHGLVDPYNEFGKGYLEIKNCVGGIISVIDLAERVKDAEKFKQTVLRNVKKQMEKYYR